MGGAGKFARPMSRDGRSVPAGVQFCLPAHDPTVYLPSLDLCLATTWRPAVGEGRRPRGLRVAPIALIGYVSSSIAGDPMGSMLTDAHTSHAGVALCALGEMSDCSELRGAGPTAKLAIHSQIVIHIPPKA